MAKHLAYVARLTINGPKTLPLEQRNNARTQGNILVPDFVESSMLVYQAIINVWGTVATISELVILPRGKLGVKSVCVMHFLHLLQVLIIRAQINTCQLFVVEICSTNQCGHLGWCFWSFSKYESVFRMQCACKGLNVSVAAAAIIDLIAWHVGSHVGGKLELCVETVPWCSTEFLQQTNNHHVCSMQFLVDHQWQACHRTWVSRLSPGLLPDFESTCGNCSAPSVLMRTLLTVVGWAFLSYLLLLAVATQCPSPVEQTRFHHSHDQIEGCNFVTRMWIWCCGIQYSIDICWIQNFKGPAAFCCRKPGQLKRLLRKQ